MFYEEGQFFRSNKETYYAKHKASFNYSSSSFDSIFFNASLISA